ncbi:TonB-dependent receptor [Novosphingobium sp.]|uniref:TonB-dependent receptor n=1 Tax=Novosphingobium sp. TaxID=1874826 RepID=UPI001D461A55|nr:TonB-dependent receptor [Novosphingobium sp.]MBX9662805.1 TonB-dependent receptor [Novosphingobium sp.]
MTASKRAATLQDTPVAVSVVEAQEIERAEIQDLLDLQTLVPSLVVRQGQTSGNTTFYIRGFGNGQNAIGLEPSVGVFIDGVYRSRSAAAISDLPNLTRVEVLRGPQSTLFGKNASVGVISLVTRKPQFEFGGHVESSFGNYGLHRFEAYVTSPVTNTLAVALGGNVNRRDGYVEDLGTGEKYNERNRWGIRGDILWQPSSDVVFRLIADYDKIDENCCIITNLVEGPTGASIRALGGRFVPEDPFSYQVAYDIVPSNRIENYGISLQGDIDLGFGTLTSISAYRGNDVDSGFDPDATSLKLFSTNTSQSQIKTFTQEIRLQSNGTGKLVDWTIGGFYFDERLKSGNDLFYGADYRPYLGALLGNPTQVAAFEAFAGVPTGTFAAPGQGISERSRQDNTAWSIFGNIDLNITGRLTASIGISHTEDRKDVMVNALSTDALAAVNLDQLGYTATLRTLLAQRGVNLQNPASVGPFVAGAPAIYAQIQQQALATALGAANPFNALRALQFFPPFLNFPNSVEDGRSRDNSTDFTVRLAYKLTDQLNVYASYATGFKASSWNLSRQSRPPTAILVSGNPVVDPVSRQVLRPTPSSPIATAGLYSINLAPGTRLASPEDVEVYELGVKGTFDRFAFTLTVFNQTLKNFQTTVFTQNGFVFANAAKQSTFGVEVDFRWSPLEGLFLSGGATFLDPVYDSFPNFGPGIDISGQQPQGVAETQFMLGSSYNFSIGRLDAFVRADWQHIGNSPFLDDPKEAATLATGGYTREQNLVNMSVGIKTASSISVSLWARNLLDDQYIAFASPALAQAGTINGAPNQPRTFGVTLHKSF